MMQNKWRKCVMDAVEANDSARLDNLLKGTDKEELDFIYEFYSPLTTAIIDGHSQIAEQLIHAGASVNFPKHNSVTLPLYEAITFSRTNIIQLLLNHGAHSEAALTQAALQRRHRIAALLLEHGAEIQDPLKPFDPNQSPIGIAIHNNDPATLKVILHYSYMRDVSIPFPLLFNLALSNRDKRCAICLLGHGYHSVQRASNEVWEPYTSCFHMAARRGMVKLVCLIKEFNPQCMQEEWLIKEQFKMSLKYSLREHPKFVAWLVECRKQPPSLQNWCKSVILAQLEVYYPQKIKELPLPKALKAFLCKMKIPKSIKEEEKVSKTYHQRF